jgi:hypothetical protein
MRKNLILMLLISLPCLLLAQGKTRLGFIPYANPKLGAVREVAYNNIYAMAVRIFTNKQRFDILDRSKFNTLKIEKALVKGDEFANSEIVAQGKMLAAQVIVVAEITALSVTPTEDKKAYTAFMTVEFQQLDVESGKSLNAFQLSGNLSDLSPVLGTSGAMARPESGEKAISKLVKSMEDDLTKWIKIHFPVTLTILNAGDLFETMIEEKRFLIANGGRNVGLSMKDKMRVVCLKEYGGKKHYDHVVDLKFDIKDGIGEELTKFRTQSKADWKKLMDALNQCKDKVFITEVAERQ